MSCILEINDPNYELLVKKHKNTEKALVEFLENYDVLRAPKHTYKGMEGKIVYTNKYPAHFKQGVILGDNYTAEEIERFNKRGFTIIGSSPSIRKLATATDIQQDRLTMLVGRKAAERGSLTVELSGTSPHEKTTMLENLNLAIRLESEKKDRQKILMMTGWQKGLSDGLWRYEIPETEIILSEYEKLKADSKEFIFLTDMIPATDILFSLYPELTKVRVRKLSKTNPFNENTNASYDPKTKVINLKDSVLETKLKSRLYHEVQHAIQEIEGFPLGGNILTVLQSFSDQQLSDLSARVEADIKDVIYTATEVLGRIKNLTAKNIARIDEIQREIDISTLERTAERRKENNEAKVRELNKKIDALRKEMTDIIFPLTQDKHITNVLNTYLYEESSKTTAKEKLRKIQNRLSLLIASKKDELQKVKQKNKTALSENMDSSESYNYYRRLAGEVEARNVQERMKLSSKERRETLLEETEDVAPEEKIMIFNYSDETNFSFEQPQSKEGFITKGVEELFESNPELANEVYSKLLTNSGISAENLLSLLEKENIVEKDCSGGKLKAEDGIRGNKFTKGSQWEIVKDLKGYPSHSQGGVDVKIGKNGFSFTRDNGVIEAKYGLVLPKIK